MRTEKEMFHMIIETARTDDRVLAAYLKGSRTIIQKLEELITERQLNDKIELNGSFCMGECSNGVCVKINDELFSVSPETVNTFFENEVLRRL